MKAAERWFAGPWPACVAAVVVLSGCGDSTGQPEAPGPFAGPPAKLEIVSGDGQTGVVGTALPLPVRVKVTDASGTPVNGQPVRFMVFDLNRDGPDTAGAATTDRAGLASAYPTLGHTAGRQRLQVWVTDLATGIPILYTDFTAQGDPGPPARVAAFQGVTGLAGGAGWPVETPFGVVVSDQYGNAVPFADVKWKVVRGNGTIDPATRTAPDGFASTHWVLGTDGSPQVATAEALGQTIQFSAYTPTSLFVYQTPGPVVAGSTTHVAVRATGGQGSLYLANLPVHWRVSSGGGTVVPVTITSLDGGVFYSTGGIATTAWTVGPELGTQTVTASAGPLSVTISASVVAAPGQR